MGNTDYNAILKIRLNTLFKQLIKFLDSNKLRWSVAYGTAIGAIRHQGMIPWDDDIDIWMPRDDYNKLMMMRESLQSLQMDVITMENSDTYWLPFAKIYDVNTTIWEYKDIPCIFGLYIDIFPFDSINISEENKIPYYKKIKSYNKKLQIERSSFVWSPYIKLIAGFHLGTICFKLGDDIKRLFISNDVVNHLSMAEKEYSFPNPNYTVVLSASKIRYCYFPFGTFEKYQRVQFEDYDVNIINGYDTVLTLIYGDYMTPPPPEKRVLAHETQRYYCNLKEGLTLEQVKERIERGEYLVY